MHIGTLKNTPVVEDLVYANNYDIGETGATAGTVSRISDSFAGKQPATGTAGAEQLELPSRKLKTLCLTLIGFKNAITQVLTPATYDFST